MDESVSKVYCEALEKYVIVLEVVKEIGIRARFCLCGLDSALCTSLR
jgi:hypothetical protein